MSILGAFISKHDWVSGTVQQLPSVWASSAKSSSGIEVTPETIGMFRDAFSANSGHGQCPGKDST